MPPFSFNKILVLELWGIGDVVLVSGILRVLKQSFPPSEITLLSKQHAEIILSNNKNVDKFMTFNFPWTKFRGKYHLWKWDWIGLIRLIKKLRAEKFELILDARGDVRNNLLSFLIGAKRRVGYNWTGGGYFLTDIVKHDRDKLHRVDAWAKLIKHIGIQNSDICPAIVISEEEKNWADNFLRYKGVDKRKMLVGVHPGAGIKTRCWPLERFSKVVDYLKQKDIQVVVFIEPDGYGQDMRVPEGCLKVKVSLREYAALIKEFDFLICNDGGAMHISAAVKTPVVAIFGPMKQEWFGPYGEGHLVVIKEDIFCRPCFDYCKHKEAYCLNGITEDQVMRQIDLMIDKTGKEKSDPVAKKTI
jgi:ADP-heptose:LPS heptosyltransferase